MNEDKLTVSNDQLLTSISDNYDSGEIITTLNDLILSTTGTGNIGTLYYNPSQSLQSSYMFNGYCSSSCNGNGVINDEVIRLYIKTGFEANGFTVDDSFLSEEETSQGILGWVSVGFVKKSSFCGSLFSPWLRIINDNKDPKFLTLTVNKDSYFEDFSIKILLESGLVLIDSTSGIVYIIQEMLLENLQKAINDIIEKFYSTDRYSYSDLMRGQGTSSLNYTTSNLSGAICLNDSDTSISVTNSGFICP